MLYMEYHFEIDENGLLLTDKADPNDTYQVQLKNTPFNIGDKFTLELDEHNRMFFKKDGPVQLSLGI